MKKIRTTCLILMILVMGMTAFAQEIPRNAMERFNAQRIAFFTEKLRLTSKEAQEFWPVYNQYQTDKNKIIETRKELTRNLLQNQKTLSDNEIEKIGDDYVASVKKEAELLQNYHEQFKKVLPIRKVVRIYHTENQFKNYLLRQIQQAQQRRAPKRMN